MNEKRNNSLNTIRLLAQIQVIWGHMMSHLQVPDVKIGEVSLQDSISLIFGYFPGVPIFFFISGFLIWKSVQKESSAKTYFKKRFLRIYPELWITVVLEIITIVIFYFDHINWGHLTVFAITQATFFQFWTPDFLRGYGCGTPNGSLWTIIIILQFYIVIWLCRKILKKKRLLFWLILEAVLIALGTTDTLLQKVLPEIVVKLYGQTLIPYLWIFIFGVIISEYWDSIQGIVKKWWFVSIPLYVIISLVEIDLQAGYPVIRVIITTLGTLGLAYAFPKINIKTDISYEMYILHMVFVNVLISVGFMGVWGMVTVLGLTLASSFALKIVHSRIILKLE